ncbi:hypothetical protein QJQ45_010982 [Haematococcus lacustris]|nr:hypothetical protein QJQ45_010982 [Haematococcus lacustris]
MALCFCQRTQVMCSCSDIFLGDLAQHQPASMRLHEFLDEARRALQGQAGPHLYLAQHPLGAEGLATALGPPPLLPAASLSSTNLWMCVRGSRSNIHHDPHHNLLCVVVGSKRVTLYPPALTPCLYPAPLAGDASNHSCVDFAAPDLVMHPLFRGQGSAEVQQQRVDVRQCVEEGMEKGMDVNVERGVTIAINFWWRSALGQVTRDMPGHPLYHLRLLAGEALGALTDQLVAAVPPADLHLRGMRRGQRMGVSDPLQMKVPGAGAARCRCSGLGGGGRLGREAGCQEGQGQGHLCLAPAWQQGQQAVGGPSEPGHPPPPVQRRLVHKLQGEGQQQGQEEGQEGGQQQGQQQAGYMGQQQGQQQAHEEGLERRQEQRSWCPALKGLDAEEQGAQLLLLDALLPGLDGCGTASCPCHSSAAWGPEDQQQEQHQQQRHQQPQCRFSQDQIGEQLNPGDSDETKPAGSEPAGAAQDALTLAPDPVSRVFAALTPAQLVRVLFSIARQYPLAVAELLSPRHLTPLAAYLLTQRLEAAEQQQVFNPSDQDEVDDAAQPLTAPQFYVTLYAAAECNLLRHGRHARAGHLDAAELSFGPSLRSIRLARRTLDRKMQHSTARAAPPPASSTGSPPLRPLSGGGSGLRLGQGLLGELSVSEGELPEEVESTDPVESSRAQISKRDIGLFCSSCHARTEFDEPQALIECSCCHRLFHRHCFDRNHGKTENIYTPPVGDPGAWYHTNACQRVHARLQAAAARGERPLANSPHPPAPAAPSAGSRAGSGWWPWSNRPVATAGQGSSSQGATTTTAATATTDGPPTADQTQTVEASSPIAGAAGAAGAGGVGVTGGAGGAGGARAPSYSWRLLLSNAGRGGTGSGGGTLHRLVMGQVYGLLMRDYNEFDAVALLKQGPSVEALATTFSHFTQRSGITGFEDGRPVCAAVLDVFGPDAAELFVISTREELRRQGHCRRLMRELALELSSAGVKRLVVSVDDDDTLSQQLWGRMGFEPLASATLRHLAWQFPAFSPAAGEGTCYLGQDLIRGRGLLTRP